MAGRLHNWRKLLAERQFPEPCAGGLTGAPDRKPGGTDRVSSVYLQECVALGAIFISYRRSDSAGESGRLSDDLSTRFGAQRVFMDVDAIQPGRDFRQAIRENVGACSILLAVIGPEWADVRTPEGTRRLENENDYVRLEIVTALGRDIPVVPVLVRGAHMPKAEQLPDEIRELAYRNSVELTHARWKSDVQVLSQALAPHLETFAEPTSVTAPSPAKAPTSPETHEQATLDASALTRVTRELAGYIGPIAELVVKRASKRCSSLSDLCDLVSQEIESSADRARFLASCRQ
jgi:hypothetical protein